MNLNPLSWRIATKIPAVIVFVGFLAVSFSGVFAYISGKATVEAEAQSKLVAVLEDRTAALTQWVDGIEGDLSVQAQNPFIIDALVDFERSWDMLGANPTRILQDLYITQNPHPIGEKLALDAAEDGSSYSLAHAKYHPYLRTFLLDRGYYDVFLFDASGNVIYSVYKEADFATNVISGEWTNTDLGAAFRSAKSAGELEQSFFDFKPYAPSNGAPASFLSTPIHNESGRFVGALVFQMPSGKLTELMQQSAGLGQTGETYIVGEDNFMRSNSRFSDEQTLLELKIETEQVAKGLEGNEGVMSGADYRGVPVVAAYKPFSIMGTTWTVIAEQEQEETYASVSGMGLQLFIGGFVGLLFIAGFGVFVGRSISQPIVKITKTISALADGNTSMKIEGTDQHDEIGEIALAAEIFRENVIRTKELEVEQQKDKERQEIEKRETMIRMADNFDSNVSGIVEAVSSASTELDATAQSMVGISEVTSSRSMTAADAAQETTTDIQAVATAAEEMTSTVEEINRQVGQASSVSRKAVEEVANATQHMSVLLTSATKIGNVVNVISSIAEQTNLLALNATIESSRAGEVGKGFAVVATEVKELASQTAGATEQILQQITELQAISEKANGSIQGVSTTIAEVDEISNAIAASMEEQKVAIQEVAQSVSLVASRSQTIDDNMVHVTEASKESGIASGEVKIAAAELAEQADYLKIEVGNFISEVRAG